MGGFSASHLIIVGVVLFLFGGKKLPELGAGLGQSIRAFKKAMAEDDVPADKPTDTNKPV